MSESRWFAIIVISILLIFVLVGFIESQASQQDKRMCIDAGMRWEQTVEGVECR